MPTLYQMLRYIHKQVRDYFLKGLTVWIWHKEEVINSARVDQKIKDFKIDEVITMISATTIYWVITMSQTLSQCTLHSLNPHNLQFTDEDIVTEQWGHWLKMTKRVKSYRGWLCKKVKRKKNSPNGGECFSISDIWGQKICCVAVLYTVGYLVLSRVSRCQ